MYFLDKDVFDARLHHDALYDIRGESPRNRVQVEKNRSKLTDFFSVPPSFLGFPFESHTIQQVIVDRRTCLYAKTPYRAMKDDCCGGALFPGNMNTMMPQFGLKAL